MISAVRIHGPKPAYTGPSVGPLGTRRSGLRARSHIRRMRPRLTAFKGGRNPEEELTPRLSTQDCPVGDEITGFPIPPAGSFRAMGRNSMVRADDACGQEFSHIP